MTIIYDKWIGRGLSWWSKILCQLPTISEQLLSTFIKTLHNACMAMPSDDRQIGAYSIGLLIPGKLDCPNKKKKGMTLVCELGHFIARKLGLKLFCQSFVQFFLAQCCKTFFFRNLEMFVIT
jgi:hypothetical protein